MSDVDELKERRAEAADRERERIRRLVPLKMGYYFDPQTREVLRRVGSHYVFVRHDRRNTKRLSPEEAETGRMLLIQGGLFWDPTAKAVYQFRSGRYILYSRDRRKQAAGKSPTGAERRGARA